MVKVPEATPLAPFLIKPQWYGMERFASRMLSFLGPPFPGSGRG